MALREGLNCVHHDGSCEVWLSFGLACVGSTKGCRLKLQDGHAPKHLACFGVQGGNFKVKIRHINEQLN